MTTLACELAKGLSKTYSSKDGAPLFFEDNFYARKFADLFLIPEKDRPNFYEAFKIVTQGQGDELGKINSLISSSLLSLLTFYPLFNNTDKNVYIEINGERYYRCFFEVKNNVIKLPSCVDVALVSIDEKKMLFIESKFTEYAEQRSLKQTQDFGKGYKALYEDNGLFEGALSGHLKLGNRKDKLVLKSIDENKVYIEGIKQSISHLIGLVKGPKYQKMGYYPKNYYKEYEKCYNEADVIQYATILFDPVKFNTNTKEFEAYSDLYRNTIIAHSDVILNCIVKWNKGKSPKGKTIEVLPFILTYQALFTDKHNRKLLIKQVLDYYRL